MTICRHICVNDILSLKKIVLDSHVFVYHLWTFLTRKPQARDAVDSMILIMYIQIGNIRAAMDETAELIASMIETFDTAEAPLLKRYCSADDDLQIQLRKFIDGVKYYCTGNLTWSL
ncbi:hypothetical protein DTO271G3_3844 [Paecilomyces variotii]|nr:hypothetical protein DTO271G3_3844 [Paecilomyces variotii]